jgi:hypothetical protein
MAAVSDSGFSGKAWNADFIGTLNSAAYSTILYGINGGRVAGFPQISTTQFDQDVIFSGSPTIYGGSRLGFAYIDTAQTLSTATGLINGQSNGVAGSAPILWGPGTLNLQAQVRYAYKAGAGAAVAEFLQTGGIKINGGTTANSNFTAANVNTFCGGITLTPAALDLAASATCATTGFGGTASVFGGASISNGGF